MRIVTIIVLFLVTNTINAQSNSGSASASASASSSNVRVNNVTERELVLSEKEKVVIIEMSQDIENYTTIYIVNAKLHRYRGAVARLRHKRGAEAIEEALISSSFEVINPYIYDKIAAKKNNYFLKDIKNDKGIYLYLSQVKGKGDDVNSTLILRNSENEILYKVNFVNAGMNEILDAVTSL